MIVRIRHLARCLNARAPSITLSASAHSSAIALARGPGRPRKSESADESPVALDFEPHKRGRPRNIQAADEHVAPPRRGRPPSTQHGDNDGVSDSSSARRLGHRRESERPADNSLAFDPFASITSETPSAAFTRDLSARPQRFRQEHEVPVLKANLYADTYRIRDDEPPDENFGEPTVDPSGGSDSAETTNPNSTATKLAKFVKDFSSSATRSLHKNAASRANKPTEESPLAREVNACRWWERFGNTRVGVAPSGLLYKRGSGEISEGYRIIAWHRLRDACPCPKCIDPSTRQRTHTSPEAYREIEDSAFVQWPIGPGLISRESSSETRGLRINWAPDHSGFYPLTRIAELATGETDQYSASQLAHRVYWDEETLLANPGDLHIQYERLAQPDREQAVLDLLTQVQCYGIAVIKGVPTAKTGDDDCTLREVMSWIGELRHTFYGETWNVKNVANSKNVAYTNLNLGLHMDLLYFTSPPRFQALHCLRNRVEGGSSYFVDGFAAAHEFMKEGGRSPKVEFAYDNDSHYLRHSHRLIEGHLLSDHRSAVNWSPPFQSAPRPLHTGSSIESQTDWYKQLATFQKVLDQPKRKWEFTMEEGDLVLFDNRRVLHARRAFRDWTEEEAKMRGVEVVEGEPSRWLKGCYLDGEVVWDKLVTLARKLEG